MGRFLGLGRLRDVSIAKKLYFIVGAMAVLIALELFTLWFSIHTLSSVRAFVGAEGLYSKAQKDAVYNLQKYSQTHDERDYKTFLNFMAVPLGDHKTRMELSKPNPDMGIAREGFLEGRNHPDDIDGMLKLFLRFHSISYINKAIIIWTKGDSGVSLLVPLGERLHQEINSPNFSKERLDSIMAEVGPLNQQLTKLEDDFSFTLGEGSRWLENLVLEILFLVALTVEITGLSLSIAVSRGINKGLNEINRASQKIAKGNLNERARVFSNDEIGMVATAINQMTEQLIIHNKEMEQFAYISSHDLQEPLRTITNFSTLLNKKYQGKLDKDADEYLGYLLIATGRMQALIKDLLDYSRIGYDRKVEKLDCNIILNEVLADLDSAVKESGATIRVRKLPVINGYSDISLLFQNVISNSIKYRKADQPLVIAIDCKEEASEWIFSIRDNGIGIEKEYQDRIFIIFQKLHNKDTYAGTGIGLAHCKKIVELHGGKIWVESEPEIGSTFYFSISKQL